MSYTGPKYREEIIKCERSNNTNLITKLPKNHNIFKYYSSTLSNGIILNIDDKPIPFIFKGIDDNDIECMAYIAIDVFGKYGRLQYVDPDKDIVYGKMYY